LHSKLLNSAKDFFEKTSKLLATFSDNHVVFMDEVPFNFSFAKKNKSRKNKKITLIISISKQKILLKPLIVIDTSIGEDEETKSELVVIHRAKTGCVDEQVLTKWVKECLFSSINSSPILVLMDSNPLHKSSQFIELLEKMDVKTSYLPEGTSCILSPLKEVIPLLISYLDKWVENSVREKERRVKLKQSMVIFWFLNSLNKVINEHASLLHSSFDCYK
jgi:hypothetical protein